ncbi:hypothetical protein, partial [Escherichia coli]|uniref:hypothetical protein n=1 Tax=Escherichia coli TaxID=562 RepID=UPI001957CEF4
MGILERRRGGGEEEEEEEERGGRASLIVVVVVVVVMFLVNKVKKMRLFEVVQTIKIIRCPQFYKIASFLRVTVQPKQT